MTTATIFNECVLFFRLIALFLFLFPLDGFLSALYAVVFCSLDAGNLEAGKTSTFKDQKWVAGSEEAGRLQIQKEL